MSSYKVERLLPYENEQLFDLAADVERYPEFLRGWIAARIQKREANVYYAEQVVGFGPVRARFGSKAVLHRPVRIDVTSGDWPFRHFQLSWIFESQSGAGCRATLVAEVTLRLPWLQRAFDLGLSRTFTDAIASFEKRAGQLYGR